MFYGAKNVEILLKAFWTVRIDSVNESDESVHAKLIREGILKGVPVGKDEQKTVSRNHIIEEGCCN